MSKINYYKLAPTRLYNLDGDSKVFRTQEGVDKANNKVDELDKAKEGDIMTV